MNTDSKHFYNNPHMNDHCKDEEKYQYGMRTLLYRTPNDYYK